jgi:hypothetical protein
LIWINNWLTNKGKGTSYDDRTQHGHARHIQLAAVSVERQFALVRRFYMFVEICVAFGTGAAGGAFITERMSALPVSLSLF